MVDLLDSLPAVVLLGTVVPTAAGATILAVAWMMRRPAETDAEDALAGVEPDGRFLRKHSPTGE